jgi:hypothetical protein
LSGLRCFFCCFPRNQIPGQERVFTLPARTIGGLGLCCLSASVVLPPLISPRISIEGRVVDFREGETGAGPWLLGALGVFLFFGGILGWITDRMARPEATEA